MKTALFNIIKQSEHDFRRPMELDFSNPEHAAYIEKCFGGQQHFRTSYPNLYILFQNGISRANSVRKNRAIVSTASEKSGQFPKAGFHDAAYIVDVLYHRKQKCAYAVGDMNLIQPAKRLFLSLDIYRGDERIAHNAEFYNGVTYGKIECFSRQFDIPQGEVQKYTAVLSASWQEQNADHLRAMLATEASDISYGTSEDVVSSMNVTDPRHKVSSPSDPIKVAYARNASNLDYCYPETRDPVTKEEEVYLDMNGEAHLSAGHQFERLESLNAILQCDGYGTIFYEKIPDETQIYPSADRSAFYWKLDCDWDSAIPDSVKFGNRLHSFDMQLKFYCSGDNALHKIVISSDDYPELQGLNSYQQISKIQLFWGCVAEDTQILMANGTTKRADGITAGDEVIDKDGKTDIITAVTSGTSQTMYHLRLESGKELVATNDHPIYTDQGLTAVIDLNTDSNVLVAGSTDKYEDVIYCYPHEYTGKVYSFELQNGNTLCTNGIITGSYTEQGKVADNWNNAKMLRSAAAEPDAEKSLADEAKQLRIDDEAGRIYA